MTDHPKTSIDDDPVKLFTDVTSKLSAIERAELAVNVAVAGICRNTVAMAPDQKVDLMRSALSFYRLVIVTEFLHDLCTMEKGAKDYDLILGHLDDLDSIKLLRGRIAAGIIILEAERSKASQKFQTMAEMLAPAKTETGIA